MERFNFISKFEKFRESPNFLLYKRIRKFRLILCSIRLNYISLSKSFEEFRVKESNKTFWSNENPFLRWNIQKRLTTDILNYLSSLGAIIDISRNFSKKELNSEALVEYQSIVRKYFVYEIEFLVLRKLRNYILHYTLLDVNVHTKCDQIKGKSKNTYLSIEILLKWDNWNNEEIIFLKNQGKQWDIEPIIYRYHKTFLKVQDLLFILVIKNYKSNFQDLVYTMESIFNEGVKLEMIHDLPFRKSTFRYLKYLLKRIKISANNVHGDHVG